MSAAFYKEVSVSELEKPWFAAYEVHGIPRTLEPYPSGPSHSFLDESALRYPKMGYIQLGYTLLYPDAKDKADRLANALHEMGVDKGDRVANLFPTSIQFVLADHAVSKAGAVLVPSSFLEPPDYLEHKFKESSPNVVFALDSSLHVVEQLRGRFDIEHVIVSKIADYSETPPSHEALPQGMYWLEELIQAHRPQVPDIEFDPEHDLETLIFTGGTTGLPKGCMLTHRNVVANSLQTLWGMGVISRPLFGNMAIVQGPPFFHAMGHLSMHGMTHAGCMQLLLTDARDVRMMANMINEHKPALAIGVPTQFMKVLNEEIKGSGLLGLAGSAAVPPEVQEQYEKQAGGQLMEAYGLSEMTCASHFNVSAIIRIFGGRRIVTTISRVLGWRPGVVEITSKLLRPIGYKRLGKVFDKTTHMLSKFSAKRPKLRGEERRATIGVPLPDTEIRIVDLDTGAEIPIQEMIEQGRAGEMLVKGPQRMIGYWPEQGKGFDEEGYIHTGDVVRIDENGYFSIVDRTKDMIIVSGMKVYSREVDDILYDHPAVAMAATVGVPDPERPGSERVRVFIQPKPEAKGKVTEQEIIDYLSKKIAKYAVPKSVVFLEEMPLTEVEKVNKKYLREIELREADLS